MFQLINTTLIWRDIRGYLFFDGDRVGSVWRCTRVVNFAQAGQALLSTYIGYECIQKFHSYWFALFLAMVAGAAIAALVDSLFMRTLFRRVSTGPNCWSCANYCNTWITWNYSCRVGFVVGNTDVNIRPPVSNVGYTVAGHTLAFSPLKLLIVTFAIAIMLILSLIFHAPILG